MIDVKIAWNKLSWELHGVSTPVRVAHIMFLPFGDNITQVRVHPNNLKVLRLRKLRWWKKVWKVDKICGYDGYGETRVDIWLPQSWKHKVTNMGFSACINNLLRYLLDGTWKDI